LKIERAEKLMHGLGGEKARWTSQINELTHTYDHVIGDVLLSSSVIAYLGAFTFDYRQVKVVEIL
jgi:dynein heavy chain